MTPYYADAWLTVYQGDARTVLDALEPESVHCVVTSPPYWGLRDYGTATWEGGDDPECDHADARRPIGNSPSAKSTLTTNNGQGPKPGDKFSAGSQFGYAGACSCGARRQDAQLGLEATPEEYVAALVDVFREVRRALRVDGTVWLNLGDSYNSPGSNNNGRNSTGLNSNPAADVEMKDVRTRRIATLKPKDLVGIPWRVAFALQADGWYLRSDIIWAKPNPMPESVTDRPTKSHEYLFLLSKSARYYFDADAVREPVSANWKRGGGAPVPEHGRQVLTEGHSGHQARRVYDEPKGANLRTVWTIATEPYPGAHFATFPRKLVESCIKAGCPEGGTVLDPFAGTGTTGLVAQSLSRRAVLIDLNADYLVQCLERNRQTPLGLVTA